MDGKVGIVRIHLLKKYYLVNVINFYNKSSYSYQKEVCGNQIIFHEMRSNNYMFSGGGHFPSDVRMGYVIELVVVCVAVVVVIPKFETWLSGASCISKPIGQGALIIGSVPVNKFSCMMKHLSFLNVLPLISMDALWNSFDLMHCFLLVLILRPSGFAVNHENELMENIVSA